MNIIGIDTSTQISSIGVLRNKIDLFEETGEEKNSFTESMNLLLNRSLNDSGLESGDIEAISVAIGPGSFTGIRVGLSFAKGLSFSLKIPLIGVSVFDAMICSASREFDRICAVMPYKEEQVSYLIFDRSLDELKTRKWEDGNWNDLLGRTENVDCFIGNFSEQQNKTIRDNIPVEAKIINYKGSGGAVAAAGLERLEQGLIEDAALVDPVYAFSIKFRERRTRLS